MARLRCARCMKRAGGDHRFCVRCGTGLPGRGATVTKAAASGYALAQHGPRPAVPWRQYLDAADPALRLLAEAQVTKAAGASPPAAVPWREMLYDADPVIRGLALDQVSKGAAA